MALLIIGEIVKTKVNLTCITDDKSLTQSVSLTEIKLKSGKKFQKYQKVKQKAIRRLL